MQRHHAAGREAQLYHNLAATGFLSGLQKGGTFSSDRVVERPAGCAGCASLDMVFLRYVL